MDYVFVTPVEVDSGGSYISHDILHNGRKKRSAGSAGSSPHYRFSAFGQELHLELKPSAILSSHFIVQVLGTDGALETPEPAVQRCFYQGFIRNDSFSSVAVSTCAGLLPNRSGLIRTRKNEFLISPLPQLLAQEHNYSAPAGHHPHVLYKRTAEEKIQRCHGYLGSSGHHPGHPPTHMPHTSRSQEREHHHPRLQKQHFCGRRKKYAPKPPTEDTYLRFDEYGSTGRPRRSAGKSQKGLNVETLVVADKKMVEKHGKANVTTYILTVMNMVSSLFKDGTIGSDINIVVVSLILLEQEPGGLLINHHADQSLNSFCQWQSALTGKNGKRHDHAILLTGFDICSWKNEPCDTLGFAPISGMCSKYRSCTINEDTGLGLAFTIAHESGHNFGMIHDGEGNPCRKAEGNIMSPTLTGNNGVFSWSSCSRQYLKKFLSTPQAGCLVDEPKQTGQYKYPDKLPGQIYDADTQCKWQFGAKAKLCSLGFVKDICKSLWCHRVGHRCETKFMPAAEGTVCGLSMTVKLIRGKDKLKTQELIRTRQESKEGSSIFTQAQCTSNSINSREATCIPGEKRGLGKSNSSPIILRLNPHSSAEAGTVQTSTRWISLQRLSGKCAVTPSHAELAHNKSTTGKWCRQGQCVKFGDHGPRPVHGQWSAWSKWSECSRTCGGGVKYQERHCNNPKPQYGGKFCPGSSRVYQLCNINPCSENSLDFRAQQCAEYNSKPFRGWFYQWKPYTKVEEADRCKLYCKAENFEFFFAMSGKVKDGTPCSPNKHDVCIDGICEPVGCDHELGSNAVLDACGVCKGDNSTCKFYKGLYLNQHKANEYYPVVTVPAGARSIEVQELQPSAGYLAVRSLGQKYYLTGGWSIDWPGEFTFAGTVFEYQRAFNHPERLYAPGPTNETLVFEVLMQGKNPGIAWKYALPKYGYISVKAICLRDQNTQVSSSFCNARTKPATEPKICNAFSCPAYLEARRMEHVQQVMCRGPAEQEDPVCPEEAVPEGGSSCSKTCGRGVRKREILCKSPPTAEDLPENLCSSAPRPESQEGCVLGRCPKNNRLQWVVSSWSECSMTCGLGVRKREMKCSEKAFQGKLITFPERRCRHIKKPILDLEETCQRGACPARPEFSVAAGWYSSPWQQCTVTCGGGVQTRSVHCIQQGRPSSSCLLRQKPPVLRACNTNFCPAPAKREDPSCVDFFSWCHLVPQHGICNHKFHGHQCCKSCTRKS
ncbi:A disintegrin and metalloproteinase with thrombospondin motifs 18 [Prionailurus iriomotensis]